MGRIRSTAACVVIAFFAASVIVPSASASPPEFGRCLKKAKVEGAGFSDAGCTKAVPTSGTYEWTTTVVKRGFTTKAKEATTVLFELASANRVKCLGASSTGEIAGPKELAGVVFTFTGCESGSLPCQNEGEPEGTIVTNPLSGVLGIEKVGIVEGKEVAAKDKLAVEIGAPNLIASFACAGLSWELKGSVLLPIPANKMLQISTVKFTQSKAEQKPDRFAGGVEDEHVLEMNVSHGPFEETGLSLALVQSADEKVEASSVS